MDNSTSKTMKNLIRAIEIALIIVGTVFVSFGSVAFHKPLNINSGGLAGIGIVSSFFINDAFLADVIYNVVVNGLTVILWIVGFFTLGWKFARRTLLSSIVFIGANALFTLTPQVKDFINYVGNLVATASPTAGNYLLGALFGGLFIGVGISFTFLGGGSTGGVDVITFLLQKYLHIKESVGSFAIDATIIIVGICILTPFKGEMFIPCLCGILSAFITAIIVDYIFLGAQVSMQMDIISDKWEEISRFVQDNLLRGATVIEAKGGYKGEERVVLRVVVDRIQYIKLKRFIADIDPKAFITCTETHAVFGEGFKKAEKGNIKKKK